MYTRRSCGGRKGIGSDGAYCGCGIRRGPHLAQKRVRGQVDDTPESLAERVLAAEHQLYAETLQRIATGEHRARRIVDILGERLVGAYTMMIQRLHRPQP